MNIVYDYKINLDESYRKELARILPEGHAAMRLDPMTSKTDGTPDKEEGFVFITDLPNGDVMKYHSEFLKEYSDAPQWFFVLINDSGQGKNEIEFAAMKHNLKNRTIYHAKDVTAFADVISQIAAAKPTTKGKALLLSKHKCSWTADLAKILFGENENKYIIMDSVNMGDTDADVLLLCGEKASDFERISLPDGMEPYFIFNFDKELQQYINLDSFIAKLAENQNMTTERLKARLFCVNMASEQWLLKFNEYSESNFESSNILLWDRFGLPLSRKEYDDEKINSFALKFHESIDKIRSIIK